MLESIHQNLLEQIPELYDFNHSIHENFGYRLNYWCTGKTIIIKIEDSIIHLSYNGFIHYKYDINDPDSIEDLVDDIKHLIQKSGFPPK